MPIIDKQDPLERYPNWARDLAQRYLTKTICQFILHGDVRDLVPLSNEEGEVDYITLRSFLADEVFFARDIVVFYDRSSGIHFMDEAGRRDFSRAVSGYDSVYGTEYAGRLPKEPAQVFTLLDNYFRLRLSEGIRVACIIDYAETIAPMAEQAAYPSGDRNALVFLQKWAHDPLLLESDFTLCLISQNLHDLSQRLVNNPHTADIKIPIPNEEQRATFANWYLGDRKQLFREHSAVDIDQLAHQTAGLNYTQVRTILADVLENKTRLTFDSLSERKKALIEAEAFGMLEFVEADYDLSHVAGHSRAKAHLRQAAEALRHNKPEVMPMGYLISGPVGTGKTFLITAFAGELGVPMVKLKNFRSQWQGVTEGNLEKILNLLDAMAPVAVMIDEADAVLGTRSATGDSGVSQRVFAQIANFMSRPQNRGRIIFFLVTARPDLMPIDLKRQGRAEEHLALFYPSDRNEREELLQVIMARKGIDVPMEKVPDTLLNGERDFSGADIEALLTRATFRAAGQNGEGVTAEILTEVVEDFIPPTYPTEVELQELVAVLECTSKTLLPEKFAEMDRKSIVQRVNQLKSLEQRS